MRCTLNMSPSDQNETNKLSKSDYSCKNPLVCMLMVHVPWIKFYQKSLQPVPWRITDKSRRVLRVCQ